MRETRDDQIEMREIRDVMAQYDHSVSTHLRLKRNIWQVSSVYEVSVLDGTRSPDQLIAD